MTGPDGHTAADLRARILAALVGLVVARVRSRLATHGAINGGPSPLPLVQPGDAVEVERVVSKDGNISLAGQVVLAAEILGARLLRLTRASAPVRPGRRWSRCRRPSAIAGTRRASGRRRSTGRCR
jgi:hypothetical protein